DTALAKMDIKNPNGTALSYVPSLRRKPHLANATSPLNHRRIFWTSHDLELKRRQVTFVVEAKLLPLSRESGQFDEV
ncbi:MAG TPA: hypothetical protein VG125_23085, partial [Pirellulales bacterium]|nr:hypothetical protein [Pirellulales bacterium]